MGNITQEEKLALISCLEKVLMRFGSTTYHWIQSKLGALCDCSIMGCYDCPEQFRTVLKDVLGNDYFLVIDNIKQELGDLTDIAGINQFLKVLEK